MKRVIQVFMAAVFALATLSPMAASAQAPLQPLVVGDVPAPRSIGSVTATRDASVTDVDASLAIHGCEAWTIAVPQDGRWRLYAPAAPAWVNAGVPSVSAGDVLWVLCGPASTAEVNTVQYFCADGATFTAHVEQVPATRTIVELDGRVVELTQTISGSGIRYASADGSILYLSQGESGRIEEGGQVTYADCTGQSRAAITGSVTYFERIALPDGAVVTVELLDTSIADAAATVIASQSFEVNRLQVPFPFALVYDATLIEENRTYTVRATITLDDQLLFTTTTAVPVITDEDETAEVELILEMVSAPEFPEAEALAANQWVWTRTVEGGVTTVPNNVGDSRLSFDVNGGMGTSTDCNSYFGIYVLSGETLTIGVQGGTLMFCPDEETTETEYIGMLGRVTGYAIEGDTLTLVLPTGTMTFVASEDEE